MRTTRLVTIAVTGVLATCSQAAAATPIVPDAGVLAPDQPALAIAKTASSTYLGGAFTTIGQPVGDAVAVDPATAALKTSFPVPTSVSGIASDGAGGVWVTGAFTSIQGSPRSGFAHLLADGKLDPAVNIALDGAATGVSTSPDHKRIYIRGQFTHVGANLRNRVAELDYIDGSATVGSFNPALTSGSAPAGSIDTVVDDGTHVYVAGDFDKAAGNAHAHVAQLELSGVPTAWSPPVNATFVGAIAAGSGGDVYIGGSLDANSGSITNLVHVTSAGTVDTGFKPNPDAQVRALALSAGKLVLSGQFSKVNNTTHDGMAVVDAASGADQTAPPIAQQLSAGTFTATNVDAMVVHGGVVYVVGNFTHFGGQRRSDAAAFDLASGQLKDWDPKTRVPAALADSSDAILLGGQLFAVNGTDHPSFAALDPDGKHLQTFAPVFDGQVSALALTPDQKTLYAGGNFTKVDGQSRGHLAAFDVTTNTLTSFEPGLDAIVQVLAMSPDGTRLYAAGLFQKAGSADRFGIAAFDLPSGKLADVTFNPTGFPNISKLIVSPDAKTLYAIGGFQKLGSDGADRVRIAALDTTTGKATAFAPVLDSVGAMALSRDGATLYVAGGFTKAGDHATAHVAALDTASGAARNEFTSGVGSATQLALSEDGSSLFVGGGQAATRQLVELDPATGADRSWAVKVPSDAYFGGAFTFQQGALLTSGPAVDGNGTVSRTFTQFSFAPTSNTAPAIAGTPAEGQTLSCSDGTWFNAPRSFTRRWLLDGAPIAGATGTSFAVRDGDAGHSLTCAVTATSGGGATEVGSAAVKIAARPVVVDPIFSPNAAPVIANVRLSNTRFRVGKQRTALKKKAPNGTVLSLALSKPATVRVAIDLPSGGIKVKQKCVADTKAARKQLGKKKKATKCTLAVASLTKKLPAGASKIAISGRFGKKALKPGRYGLTITATDDAKRSARAVRVRFTVV